jgi:hypothetical protein
VNIYNTRVFDLADEYASEFSALESAGEQGFYSTAVSLATSFEHKDKIEVQVIDAEGIVLVTTTGFQPIGEKMPDYEKALLSTQGIGSYNGKNSSGEEILASTVIIKSAEGKVIGAYRWITSMKKANRNNFFFIVAIFLVGILLFLPAGKMDFFQGWLLMATLFIPMFFAGIVMMI